MLKTEAVLKRLEQQNIACRRDVCGRDVTSFRIGGRLGLFALPNSAEELLQAVAAAEEIGCRYYVIGNGSNLLISDRGVDALFIRPSGKLCEFKINGASVAAGSGASLAAVAKASVNSGLMGLEWASGIPGSIGGAVAMNAGAYGGEIKDVIVSVDIISGGKLCSRIVAPDEMGYRYSAYSFPESIVVGASFKLKTDDGFALDRMRDYNERRRQKQPVELPSAGSAFKRPQGNFAAALIDKAGLKGASVGAAEVSPKHAGFIVNNGGATFDDVVMLMDKVRDKVFSEFGVELEPEIKIIS